MRAEHRRGDKLDNTDNTPSSNTAIDYNGKQDEDISVDDLLKLQSDLAGRNIYKTLDRIIAEDLGPLRCPPADIIIKIRQAVLKRVRLFESLPPAELFRLASKIENVMLPPGKIVYRPTAESGTYYAVVSGTVRVYRRDKDGTDVTVALRGAGDGFGEISLLTGEPHSAFVETVERSSLILIPGNEALRTIFSNPASALICSRILAERLSQGYSQITAVSSNGHAYRHFISEHLMKKEPMFIGSSQAVMKIITEIENVSERAEPVLVLGEPGTELADIAGLIHEIGRDGRGMLLEMDAKTRRKSDDDAVGSGEPQHLGLIQAGILFGRGYNALPFAPDRQLGLLVMAIGGTVVIHDIEYLAPLVQERLADYIENKYFTAIGDDERLYSDTRIIGTTCSDLCALAEEGSFNKRLYKLISALSISAPPLRKRKRDISLIVDELIKRYNRQLDKNIKGISGEAYKSLMEYDWPGNTEELRVVIRRAVSICTGERLLLDDIFIAPPPVTGKYTFDLLKVPAVARVLKSGYYPRAAHLLTIPFFALLIGLGLFGSQAPDRNAALILTWAFWEPPLIIGIFFLGRMWCSICPMGALSGLIRQAAGLNLKVPALIKNYGFYFSAAGIAAIFWAEAAFDMPRSPRATALLVVPIVTLACIGGLLFQRRAWCRYLCPLGGMVGVLASCSIIEMRSNYGVCNNTCSKHDCYAGNAEREGCPMWEGPFSLNSNRTCVLCANCVKICPNQSPVLNVRLPGYELWTTRKADLGFAVIVISLIGTQLFRGIEKTGYFFELFGGKEFGLSIGSGVLVIGSVVLAALFTIATGRHAFSSSGSQHGDYLLITYALMPLVFASEAGFHMENLLTMGGQILPVLGRQFGAAAALPGISASQFTVKTLQAILVLLGGIGSAWTAGKIQGKSEDGTKNIRFRRIITKMTIVILTGAYLLMFLNARQ